MKLQIGWPVVMFIILSTSITTTIGKDYAKDWKFFSPSTWSFFGKREVCTHKFINPNFTKLNRDLHERVYGQHLINDVVVKAIQAHVESNVFKKALVLSFHGRTGSGKNFVSQIISESLFTKGMDSKFVHLFIPELHFPHKELIRTYKDQLQNWIRGNISSCPYQLFIFDEMQSLLPELIDVIKPFIDYHNHKIDGVDYRRAIYIFLSSTSGQEIADVALRTFKDGRKRESMTLKDYEGVIRSSSYSQQGTGLWHSKLIDHHLISHFVPFLPLEREHVRKCIQQEMRDQGWPQCTETENEVLNYLSFGPVNYELYAAKGCKNIHEKIYLVKW
ncbi:torsin-1A-like [Antedon mediterranea]|uniref:torsin-1A-like n=1 Tax=Antedon mediterranea TaxID=105859 RepID=UPI003AF68452